MRFPWRRRRATFCDFSQVVEAFIRDLRELADHIEEHDFVVDAARTAAQARVAAQMLEHANNFEGPPNFPWPDGTDEERRAWSAEYVAEENKAWADAWAYVGEHIRKWWD